MIHKAKKVVIITEKIITEQVANLVEECGATGYTLSSTGGKGSRGIRSSERGGVNDSYANVKFEIITANEQVSTKIAKEVADKFFNNYSGITYVENVEIVRPQKF